MDDVHLQYHVVVHEVCQRTLVGHNATDLCCSEEHVFRFLLRKERLDGFLTGEVKLLMRARNNIGIALALQFAHNGATYHTTMASYVYLRIKLHLLCPFVL